MPIADKELEALLKEVADAADAHIVGGVELLQEEIGSALDVEHGKTS